MDALYTPVRGSSSSHFHASPSGRLSQLVAANQRRLALLALAGTACFLLFTFSSSTSLLTSSSSSSHAPPVKSQSPLQAQAGHGIAPTFGESGAAAIQPVHDFAEPLFALGQEKIDLLKRYEPKNYPNKHGYTFATLLCTRNDAADDIYLLATRALVYRLLWDPVTGSPDKPVTVFVAPFVPQWKRDILSAEGAKVVEIPLIEIHPKTTNLNSERWRDQYTKLNMWNQTRFTKIAYFDADAFPMRPVDELFTLAQTWHCKEELLDDVDRDDMASGICDYTMAGVPIMPFPAIGPNGGLLIFSPNHGMHRRLLRLAPETDSYNSELMEQGMFEWVYGWQGPFPAQQLERKWNGLFPKPEEEHILNVVHQKIWNKDYDKEGLGWMTKLWDDAWTNMNRFYNSEEFVKARKAEGLRTMDDYL